MAVRHVLWADAVVVLLVPSARTMQQLRTPRMSTARPRRWCSRNGFGICFLTRRVLASSDALDFLGFFLLEAPPEPGVLASFGEQAAFVGPFLVTDD